MKTLGALSLGIAAAVIYTHLGLNFVDWVFEKKHIDWRWREPAIYAVLILPIFVLFFYLLRQGLFYGN